MKKKIWNLEKMRDENELRKKINEMMKNGVGQSRNHSV
jgi:hypothetical protein